MPGGDVFSTAQEAEIDRAIRGAETTCRFEFSVYVGPVDGDVHAYARRLHAALSSPDRSVLILVDPAARALEVVTGSVVRRSLNDDAVRLAAPACSRPSPAATSSAGSSTASASWPTPPGSRRACTRSRTVRPDQLKT